MRIFEQLLATDLGKKLRQMTAAIYLVPPKPPVRSPYKLGKVRTVANSASTCKGVSLKFCLETEPDLLNNMFCLLIRFRKKSVALSAFHEHAYANRY